MYKKASLDDAGKILSFCLELKAQDAKMSFTDFDSLEIVEGHLNDPNTFLYIALDNEEVIAMFRAVRGRGNKTHSCKVACAVRRDYRKRNLATEITLYGLADIKTEGVIIARTYIYSWNEASIATIKKCGFEESGRVFMHQYEEKVGGYIDDLIFHKLL
jgi:RimJ/RimL family protein N-acetyltransferase